METATATEPCGLKILVVEDNATLSFALSVMLRQMRHEADAAGDAARALEAVMGKRYDVVLMDIQLSGMDGLELASRLRSDEGRRGVPWLIGMSGNEIDRSSPLASALDEFVPKPVLPGPLSRVLEARLRTPGTGAGQSEAGLGAMVGHGAGS